MMVFPALCLFLVYIFATPPAAAVEPPAYNATEVILLNCGQSEDLNDDKYRRWEGDEGSRYLLSNSSTRVSLAVTLPFSYAPYETARVIHLPLTYTFTVSEGRKFLRLYFYPTISGYDTSQSLFMVTANSFTLLRNFNAFLYSKNTSRSSFMKEFVVNVGENQQLNLTFSPNSNSFAFVNGIEIVSMPDSLYFDGKAIKYADGGFDMRNDTSMENLYRLDVGGRRSVDIQDDSGGMFRAWSMDDNYLIGNHFVDSADPANIQLNYTAETPPYSAPAVVYTSARVVAVVGDTAVGLEWLFPVDSGFYYLLRLHFCEFTLDVRAVNQRVFTVNINYKTMEFKADIVAWAGGPDIPIYRDYVTWVPDDGRRGMRHLRLSLFPYLEGNPKYYSALLNGLEIFKLSDANRSLAAANPVTYDDYEVFTPPPEIQQRKNKSRRSSVVFAVTGSLIGVFAIVAAVSFLTIRWRKKVKASALKTSWSWSWSWSTATTPCESSVSLSSDSFKHFTIDEIKTATHNFSNSFIIGKGGFGNVYKGLINRGAAAVAVKRLHSSSDQGAREFLTEIEILSKLRHLHLVSLLGYCNYGGEMILVYDYMARGTLHDHLYNPENPPLTWSQRLQICLGAAKGLHYLHNGAERVVIHRDIKSTNILLDEEWVAKISDFGISKMGKTKTNDSFSHISTNVKGTFGYLDPKYFSTHQLTRKSDVYAFGVVLCEVLSGRAAVDTRLDEEQHSLAGWARYCIRVGEADRLIDQNLMGQISPACFKVFVGIAGRCIHMKPLERPTMADVVMGLELSLVLQHRTADSGELQVEDESMDEFIQEEDNPSSSARMSPSEG